MISIKKGFVTAAEAATIMGIPVNSVYYGIHRGKYKTRNFKVSAKAGRSRIVHLSLDSVRKNMKK